MSFVQFNLHTNICKALSVCGYTTPTPVQAKSIPEVMNGRDIVVSAQTGTGKTAAFVLPALHRLSEVSPASAKKLKKPRVLILTPTRELASQITDAASRYGKFLRFNIVSLVGGMPYPLQIRDLARGADILVATPGRLLDHIERKRVDLSQIEMLVLDEADRMLDMGFIDDVRQIATLIPTSRQTLLFSATLDSKLMKIVQPLLKGPLRIDLSHENVAAPQIEQKLIHAKNIQHKSQLLKEFLAENRIFKVIIFCATKIGVDNLANQLQQDGFAAAAIHGDLRQRVRNRTLEQFRRGKVQILVATDVAARGIDVNDITHVINYDLPKFCEDYVHRIGRTGRAGKAGIAISFVLPSDIRNVQRIERYLNKRLLSPNQVAEFAPAKKRKDDRKRTYAKKDGYPKKNSYAKKDGYPKKDGYSKKEGYAKKDGYPKKDSYAKKKAKQNKPHPLSKDSKPSTKKSGKSFSFKKKNATSSHKPFVHHAKKKHTNRSKRSTQA